MRRILWLAIFGVSAYFQLETRAPSSILPATDYVGDWETVFADTLGDVHAAHPAEGGGDNNGGGIEDGEETQRDILAGFFDTRMRCDDVVEGAFLWNNFMGDDVTWSQQAQA